MIAYIRQTAKEFRYYFLNGLTRMLIQQVIFDKNSDKLIIKSYVWVPDDVKSTCSHNKSETPSDLNAEVYMPRTLHIEDNAEIRSISNYFLKKYFDLKLAPDGKDPLNLVKENSFDVIIMDINLGDALDGIETAHKIRKMDSYKYVPVIAVTANLASSTRNSCLDAGMDAFLPKPFRREDLINTINFVLEHKGVAGI